MRVLIVKLSSLGDVVHTLPVIQDIQQAMPGTRIDWVVEKSFAPLLTQCPGIERVIPCELRRWRKAPLATATRIQWRLFKQELQAQAYDAVIDLQGLSKSALVAWMARLTPGGKRFAMAHQTEGSGYEAPTRWVAHSAIDLPRRVHAVHRGRLMCARALGYEPGSEVKHVLGPVATTGAMPTVLLVHGTSRADKEWPFAHWVELGAKLRAAGLGLALAHGSEAERITSQALAQAIIDREPGSSQTVTVWPRLPLDQLTGMMASCCGVVGVDSGLSHIAVALGLPHVQIYNFDTAWRTGPPAPGEPGSLTWQRSVYAQPTPAVEAVWQAWQACLASRPAMPVGCSG